MQKLAPGFLERNIRKPGSHMCDKHNTSDISISISTRKKEHVPFFLCCADRGRKFQLSGALKGLSKEMFFALGRLGLFEKRLQSGLYNSCQQP